MDTGPQHEQTTGTIIDLPRQRFGDQKFRAEGQDRQINTHTRSTVEVPPELKNREMIKSIHAQVAPFKLNP